MRGVCKNCGDVANFNSLCDPRRERLGWCVACFKQCDVAELEVLGYERSYVQKCGFGSKLSHPSEDS